MRHRKTPVSLLRERADRDAARVQTLEQELAAEKKWSAHLLDKNAARINADLDRMQRERNA